MSWSCRRACQCDTGCDWETAMKEDLYKTETRLAEELEVNLRAIIEKNVDGIIITDGGGVVRFVNPAAEAMLGRKAEELLHFLSTPLTRNGPMSR